MRIIEVDFDKYLSIDTDNGRCEWKDTVSKYHAEKAGKEAGVAVASKGKSYWVIKIAGKAYKRSHIVFWKVHGKLPHPMVDHINGNSLDDRIANLREADYILNNQNRSIGKRGRELPMGVRIGHTNKKGLSTYEARIRVNGKLLYLGSFRTVLDAESAYRKARKELMCV